MAQIDVTIYQHVLTKWKHHYLLKRYCKWLILGSLYLLWLIDIFMDCCMDYYARRSCQCLDVWMLMWSIWPLQSMLWTRAKSVQQTKWLLQRCNVWHTHTHICHCRYIYIYLQWQIPVIVTTYVYPQNHLNSCHCLAHRSDPAKSYLSARAEELICLSGIIVRPGGILIRLGGMIVHPGGIFNLPGRNGSPPGWASMTQLRHTSSLGWNS